MGEEDPNDVPAPGDVDWDKVSDPVRLDALTHLINISSDKIKAIILEHSLPVKWRGQKTSVPRATAMKIYELKDASDLE